MRVYLLGVLLLVAFGNRTIAQQVCGSFDYEQRELRTTPASKWNRDRMESFIRQQLDKQSTSSDQQRGEHLFMITIPVVVHVLYNNPAENISDEQIFKQLDILNKSFRHQNADSVNTPDRFKLLAADCDIEFKLAISDPRKMGTTGIVRKYTPVTRWEYDNKVKFSAEAGDDAWDPKNYLNIWVCNLNRMLGYSSFPGDETAEDGIVMSYAAFAGKTLVHETGHWLGLRHIWGDALCGDDMVADTPPQSTFTSGCPTGIRLTCNSGPSGDMYMNYMDLSGDACINLFTEGQKARMRTLFNPGGPRHEILTSYALSKPLVSGIPVYDELPKWFYANLYPNPSGGEVTMDVSYDVRWIGKIITITTVQGQSVMQVKINAKVMKMNISRLKPGVYFLTAKREDGLSIKQKLIKM